MHQKDGIIMEWDEPISYNEVAIANGNSVIPFLADTSKRCVKGNIDDDTEPISQ